MEVYFIMSIKFYLVGTNMAMIETFKVILVIGFHMVLASSSVCPITSFISHS
jgi:hypothetical protein